MNSYARSEYIVLYITNYSENNSYSNMNSYLEIIYIYIFDTILCND